jgi:hypothetical protein
MKTIDSVIVISFLTVFFGAAIIDLIKTQGMGK